MRSCLATTSSLAVCILLMHTHIPLTPFSWGMPLELVFLYGYPQLTYWAGLFKVLLDQWSHIHAMAPFQANILHSSTGTSHSSTLSTNSRILFKRALKIDLLFYYTLQAKPGQHNSLAFPLASMSLTSILWAFESIQLWCLSYHLIGIHLGRVDWNAIRMAGWALCPSLIPGWCQAFCVPIFLSGLVPLCSWIHSALFCTWGFVIPTSYIFVLRDTDQTCLSMNHFSSVLLLTSASSLLYLH